MGSKSMTGGVIVKGRRRIQFDFMFEGIRYRPTLQRVPSEANLRRAREHLAGIKERIAAGAFSFAEEFPDFRNLKKVPDEGSPRTCAAVFDAFLAHCESRVTKGDLAAVTLASYRRILSGIWRPEIGSARLFGVRYSTLVKIADNHAWSKKTYNNVVSALRVAFKFGYRDHPEKHNPAWGLKSARIRKRDRPIIDPFTIQEAETLIAAIRKDWGEAQGNYDEFRFFTGLRPSEQIALATADFDVVQGTLSITKARVAGIDADSTKTGVDRRIVLCPRALDVLRRQLTLRARLERAGKIHHDQLFFKETGEPIRNLQYPYFRWRRTLGRMHKIRYRKPYCARHSSVSWNLMIGKKPLWVAKQHGHSIATMLRVYAAWTEGAIEADIKAIKRAMAANPSVIERPACPQASVLRPSQAAPRPIAPTPGADLNIKAAAPSSFATGFATGHQRNGAKCSKKRRKTGGERGIRTRWPRARSVSCWTLKYFRPLHSPQAPGFGTGFGTGPVSRRKRARILRQARHPSLPAKPVSFGGKSVETWNSSFSSGTR